MEYCRCGSVGSYLKKCNHVEERVLREVVSCSLLGLNYLHNRKMIHRVLFSVMVDW